MSIEDCTKSVRALCLAGVAAGALAPLSPASAQQTDAEDASMEAIIVFGEKLNRSRQETSTSVGRLDAGQLADVAAFDVQQAFDRLVNVNAEGANGGFVIRGIRFNDVSDSGGVGALGVFYIDGVRLSQRGLRFGPDLAWDIASIEVLRGAQSTLQGRNALAGAIHVRTTEAGYDWEAAARAFGAEGNTFNVAAAVGGPIVDDVLAFRLSAEYQESDGFVANPVLGTDADFSQDLVLRGKLLFEPTEALRFDLVINYADVEQFDAFSDTRDLNADGFIDISPDSIGATPIAATSGEVRRRALLNLPNREETETFAGLLRATWYMDDAWTVTSETAFSRDESLILTDNDQGVFDYSGLPISELPFQDPLGIDRFERTDIFDGIASIAIDPIFAEEEINEIFSQELRFNYDGGERLRFVVGGYFTSEDEDEISYTQQVFTGAQLLIQPAALEAVGDPDLAALITSFYNNLIPLSVLSDEPVWVDNFAFFGELDFDLTEAITVTAGLRYDDETLDVGVISSGVLVGFPDPAAAAAAVEAATGGAVPAAAVQPLFAGINQAFDTVSPLADAGGTFDERSFSAWLPKVGIRYDVTEDVSVGAVVQRGYRAGSLSINVPRQLSFSLDPEFTWNYELYFRSQFADNRGTVNANLFFTDWSDQQVGFALNEANPFDNGAANASSSELYGFEIEGDFILDNGFSVFGGVGFTQTKFRDFTLSLTEDLERAGFTNADLADLGTDFTGNEFPFAPKWSVVAGGSWTSGFGLKASVNLNYQSRSFDGPDNLARVDARTLIAARLDYQRDRWHVFAFVRNLLDNDPVVDPGPFRVRLGDPRVFGGGLQVTF